ncbi:hypothetical protein KKG45_13715 [bacterium]|nr:hypothetical protein [bacterium]MBU1074298.1 hypothetical protein [bacterium]MBU1674605.1 hypothetical protein [bacterium]
MTTRRAHLIPLIPLIRRVALAVLLAGPAAAAPLTNLFMLHHSTGRNLIAEGDVRGWFAEYTAANGTAYDFWDHDYNYIGLTAPDGSLLGTTYGIPGDNTDPDGLLALWTTANGARDQILANHQVIGFKSCYPASNIETDTELEERKQLYLQMRDVFDQYPDKVFVVMSQPPRHRLSTSAAEADRARDFADWLASDAYLAGHDNVVCIDLFNELAQADDGSATRNMLRYEYERSHYDVDSHPNTLANETAGPWFVSHFVEAASALDRSTAGGNAPARVCLRLSSHPNPFNPRTTVVFALDAPARVALAVYDLSGARVALLADGVFPAGDHAFAWDGRDVRGTPLASGVYLARAVTRGAVQTRRMTLVR